ncbi:MAG TPA: monofunctional biosynthetic peptidoglycan transglycosylase [Candidatus Kapabacteria bacterium]|nr:monofunctional biosynthetic peptidoglycan transglycosylase [Candidatus Kapabacteria bacterium]
MKFIRIVYNLVLWTFVSSVFIVLALKYINPPLTPIIAIRAFENIAELNPAGIHKVWKNYDEVSPYIFQAIVGGEDARFMKHSGIDWRAVRDAQSYNRRNEGRKKRGASTVTMQTAKNTFLTHSRNYIRKAFEAYFTYMIEAIWGKKRILEMYVNVVEFGDGIYGAEAGARKNFGKSALNLNRKEAALIAAVLPNPRRWTPASPTPYIDKRANWIMGRMGPALIPKNNKK